MIGNGRRKWSTINCLPGPGTIIENNLIKRRPFMTKTRIGKAVVAAALGILLGGGYFWTELNA
jgi:hypothetical protein